jgi:hypothetical protein
MAHSEQHGISAVMHKKVVGRPWPPGRSGNPGGRPRAALDIQALARQHTPEAIAALVAALANPRERVSAAVALLDRGWGKPTQPLAGDADAAPLVVDFRWADAAPLQSALEPEPIGDVGVTEEDVIVAFAGEC